MPLLPVPLPDELISSVIARGARENGLSSRRQIQDAYGDKRGYHSFLFGDSLKRIEMLTGKPAEKLLLEHTVFPYATAFMSVQVSEKLAQLAIANTARGRMNFVSARVSKGTAYRRACPRCIDEDLKTIGTSYWRVSHQLPLSTYCPVHNIPLGVSDIALHRNAHCCDIALPDQGDIKSTPKIIQSDLAKDLTSRAIRALKGANEKTWKPSIYRETAIGLGFNRPLGTLAARAFSTEFQEFFGSNFLDSVGCALSQRAPWPAHLSSETNETEASTTRHLLLQAFLHHYKKPLEKNFTHYKPRDRAAKNYALLDSSLANKLESKFGSIPLVNANLKVADILIEVDAKSLYSHHRDKLPLTSRWIDRLKSRT
jgi:hypothetical protein